MKLNKIGQVWDSVNRVLSDFIGLLSAQNFVTIATWRNDFSSLLQTLLPNHRGPIEGILQGRCGKYTCTSPWENYQMNPFQNPWRQAFKHERTTSFPGFSLFLPNKRQSPGNAVDERNEVSDVEIEEARNLQNPIMLNDVELRIKFTSRFNGYKRIF